jgi:hypothetical protein
MPRISPARTSKLISLSGVPKRDDAGMESARTASLGAPKFRSFLTISRRFPPIIFSAIEREVSRLGSQLATTRPARRIVAVSQSALISCSLCEM